MRPTLIVAEPIPHEGISTRKLVLETAYYNVLTAYSFEELLDTIVRFPNFDIVIVHSELKSFVPDREIPRIRELVGQKSIMAISSSEHKRINGADRVIPSHDPQELLRSVEELVGRAQEEGTSEKKRT